MSSHSYEKNKSESSEAEVASTGHVYDGIEELDHPVPRWFAWLFYLSIAFAAVYFYRYSIGEGPTLVAEYERARTAESVDLYERGVKPVGAKLFSANDLKLIARDPTKIKLGSSVYQSKCVACHGSRGEGGIGPNLTDSHWLHGGKLTEVFATINQGIPEKGMPPWGAVLTVEEAQGVLAFVRSLAGSNPPGAKAPQGEPVILGADD